MSTIREEAHKYEPPKTKNIADLPQVDVQLDLKDGSGQSKDGEFKYKYISVDGSEYRVPGTVLGALKELLIQMPGLMFFKVTKTGEGFSTKYTVIPINNEQTVT